MVKKIVENYEHMTDEELVSLIKSGSFELFRIIMERYSAKILFFVNSSCPQELREDAFQEAVVALYSAVCAYDGVKSSFSTFATLCIKRSVQMGLRNRKSRKNIPDELLSPIEEFEIADCNSPEKIFFDRESYKALTSSIKLELSRLEYSVLELYLSGKSYAQISAELCVNEKSVNNALARIRKKLKNK